MKTSKIILISILAIISMVFIFLLMLVMDNFYYKENIEISFDTAKQIAIERVKKDYNYNNLNGHNLRLKATSEDCGNNCYKFTFEYDVNQSKIKGLEKVEASLFVIDGKAKNFTKRNK